MDFQCKRKFCCNRKRVKKNLFSVLKAINPKSLDSIIFRDENYKTIENYSGYNSHPNGAALDVTKKHINAILKKNSKITMIELLKR
jgi:hypothetical protein